jgi:hypothetical protein
MQIRTNIGDVKEQLKDSEFISFGVKIQECPEFTGY